MYCIPWVPGAWRGPKRASDSQELELEMIVSHHVFAGNWLWPPARATNGSFKPMIHLSSPKMCTFNVSISHMMLFTSSRIPYNLHNGDVFSPTKHQYQQDGSWERRHLHDSTLWGDSATIWQHTSIPREGKSSSWMAWRMKGSPWVPSLKHNLSLVLLWNSSWSHSAKHSQEPAMDQAMC